MCCNMVDRETVNFFFFIVAKSNNKMGINTKTTLYYFQSLIIMELQNNVVKHKEIQKISHPLQTIHY